MSFLLRSDSTEKWRSFRGSGQNFLTAPRQDRDVIPNVLTQSKSNLKIVLCNRSQTALHEPHGPPEQKCALLKSHISRTPAKNDLLINIRVGLRLIQRNWLIKRWHCADMANAVGL
jgi:hypothetical protein